MTAQTPLQIETRRQNNCTILRIAGSATMDVCDQLKTLLLIPSVAPGSVMVLDLAELDFICSDALGVVIAAHLKHHETGGAVRLARPTDPIRRLLELTRLGKLLSIYPTVEAAVAGE